MSTRFFNSGGSGSGRYSVASKYMRIEIEKKGKLPPGERYKRIMKKKLDEVRQEALGGKVNSPFVTFNVKEVRKMSKRAEQALKEVAEKKARKEAKDLRQMVIVQPRAYPNGSISRKGQIFDVAGNIVAKVNTKNGRISTLTGWGVGKYKPKSVFTDMLIRDTIDKHSPYFIQQRKLQALQAQGIVQFGVHGPAVVDEVINIYGRMGATGDESGLYSAPESTGPRQNIAMTSWGARSDNVWGVFADNVWGQSADNVWGTNSTDIWGGIGRGNLWGARGPNIMGTGNGINYLRKAMTLAAIFFGLKTKSVSRELAALRSVRASSSSGSSATMRSAPAPRSSK